jgi:hypothetical protein
MTPIRKLSQITESLRSHTQDRLVHYTALLTQVEALRVEVSALEAEIRRTERSSLPAAHKAARIRGLASRSSESYGRMLSLLRQAADVYPAVLVQPLDIPHSFTPSQREQLIDLPERPPALPRRDLGIFIALGVAFFLGTILLSELYPAVVTMPVLR